MERSPDIPGIPGDSPVACAHARVTGAAAATLLVAVAYFIAAWLAMRLAVPPGYASPVWPAAGVALAGVLLLGWRAAPGVLLGSLGANFLQAVPDAGGLAGALLVSAGIGAGAMLQALLSARLVRRRVRDWRNLERAGDVLRFLLLAGPLGCLVSASLGVLTLHTAGLLGTADPWRNWLTWWSGDTLGVVLVAPLVLLLAGARRHAWPLRRALVLLPVVLVATLVIFFALRTSELEVEKLRMQFERETEALADGVRDSIDTHVDVLYALESLFASSSEVEMYEFRTFAGRAVARYRGLDALSWNPLVTAAAREALERDAWRNGLWGFRITERDEEGRLVPAAERPVHVAVRYIEPMAGNAEAIGFDVYSNAARREALDLARDTGAPVATSRIHLVQAQGGTAGMLMFLPVYRDGVVPDTVAERRERLVGFATGVYRIDELLSAVRARLDAADIAITVEDMDANPARRLLYADPETGHLLQDLPLEWQTNIDVGSRDWRLRFTAGADFVTAHGRWHADMVMVAGLVLTGLLEALLLVFSGRASAVAQLVADRTAELTLMNRELTREIGERRSAEASLLVAKEAAEAANRAKSDFLANMSHEIRTPMNAVMGMTEMTLADDGLRHDHRENLQMVRASARSLLDIINEILDFSRVEAGRLVLEETDFRPREMLDGVVGMLRPVARGKGLPLVCEVDDAVPHRVHGDPGRLRQVLVNLVGNAIKFTREGRVTVRLGTEQAHADGCVLVLVVQDTGIGIAPERQAAVFEPFCQADNSTTRAYGGTGLGLTICQRLVTLMGGSVELESEPGVGTTFTARVPVATARRVERPAAAVGAGGSTGTALGAAGLQVLLAEDNLVNQKLATRLLTRLGHAVTVVENGREAVEAMRNRRFDLVLMDLQMPVMDGLEALGEIRAMEEGGARRTPVIALTAHAMDEHRVRCLEAGMDGYLTKPFELDDFDRTLRSVAEANAA